MWERKTVLQQHSGSFHHCTKSTFCKQVSWITACAKRRRKTIWALLQASLPSKLLQLLLPEVRDRCLQTWGQILTWAERSQFPESARHCTTLPLVRSWPQLLLLFLQSHRNLSATSLKLLVRAECSFIYFHGAASDFEGEKRNPPMPDSPLPGWNNSCVCRRAVSSPVSADEPTCDSAELK